MRSLTLTASMALAVASGTVHAQAEGARAAGPARPARASGTAVARSAPTQPPTERVAARSQAPSERATVRDYDQNQSRALFGGCDGNADDRLDLFEVRLALRDLGDPNNPNWFRRLDTDRDGFLDWPEFDRFYGDLIHDGGTLHLWLARPLPPREQPVTTSAGPSSAPRRTIDLFDTNHDGVLDMAEAQAMLRELGVPPSLISMAPTLDLDHNGTFSEQELAPAMQQLHIDLLAPVAGSADAGKPGAALAGAWSTIDLDGNQSIDAGELTAALRRIDPQLERWSARILATADHNHDGKLTTNELPAPERADVQAMAERPSKR